VEALAADRLVFYSALAVPAIALILRRRIPPPVRGTWLFLFSSVAVYLLLLASVQLLEARLAAEVSAFDLDGDDWFSESEMSPAYFVAMDRVASDTGRVFAPVTAAVYAPLYVAIVFGLAKFLALSLRLIRR
jgi:hypothetical protein